MKSLYETLQVDPNATDKEIKDSYHKLIRKFHPDKGGNYTKDEFISIEKAWKILNDPHKRTEYDVWFREQMLRENSVVIYDTLKLDEMQCDDDDNCVKNKIYSSCCRCGGCYQVDSNELKLAEDFLLISCDNCSLFLKLLI